MGLTHTNAQNVYLQLQKPRLICLLPPCAVVQLDRNRELLQRLEEQMLQMKEMNREVVDLRKQLSMTQTGDSL